MAAPVVSVAKLPTPAAPALTSVAGPTQEAFRHAPPDRGRAAVGAALRSCLEALPTGGVAAALSSTPGTRAGLLPLAKRSRLKGVGGCGEAGAHTCAHRRQ